jgi:prefoldin subunit 5
MAPGDPIVARINDIARAYDRAHPDCKFQTVCYNRVPGSIRDKLVRPPHANEALWKQAVDQIPDTDLAPCLVVGFQDLLARISEEHKALEHHAQNLTQVSERVDKLSTSQQECTAKLARAEAQQRQLHHRVLALVNRLVMHRAQTLPMLSSEHEFLAKLRRLQQELNQPGLYMAKLQELQATLAHVSTGDEGVSMDSENLNKFLQLVDLTRQYIVVLTQTLTMDTKDVESLVGALDAK